MEQGGNKTERAGQVAQPTQQDVQARPIRQGRRTHVSPLLHAIPRELRMHAGRYLGIFVLIMATVAFVAGFLDGAASIAHIVAELPDTYRLEDARVVVASPLTADQVAAGERAELTEELTEEVGRAAARSFASDYERLTLHPLFSRDLPITREGDLVESPATVRVFALEDREEVDLPAVHEGRLPEAAGEIALTPTAAHNHGTEVGDTVEVAGVPLTVVGLATVPDYTTLFEKNTDFVMDDITFDVGLLTRAGYDALSAAVRAGAGGTEAGETYTYAVVFDNEDLTLSERVRAETNLARMLIATDADVSDLIDVDSNQGVTFAADDVEGDQVMYWVLLALIMIIMGFVFVVITDTTIEEESATIGTLLASGWTRGQLIRHYLAAPLVVATLAAAAGSLVFEEYFVEWTRSAYYNSYSLPPFRRDFNPHVFVLTTVLPVVLLGAITTFGLLSKTRHTPLEFLRHEIRREGRVRSLRLPEGWPFARRFRARVLLDNLGSFATLFAGIALANVIIIFGFAMSPIIHNAADALTETLPAEHLYAMREEVDLPEEDADVAWQAERVEVYSFDIEKKWGAGPLAASTYGIDEGSRYWQDVDVSGKNVTIGAGLAHKCNLSVGDDLVLYDRYDNAKHRVVITAIRDNGTDMCVYLSREYLNFVLDQDADTSNAWVSDAELHFAADDVAQVTTPDDVAKMATQMDNSMGSIMGVFVVASMVIFVVVVYLLTKTVLERSARAISQLKVFGYRSGELSRLYSRAVTIAVVVSIVGSIPVVLGLLSGIIDLAMVDYDIALDMTIPLDCLLKSIGTGLASYAVVAVMNAIHLRRVPLLLALASTE